jgi:sugar phosphate isomerase/epimerase
MEKNGLKRRSLLKILGVSSLAAVPLFQVVGAAAPLNPESRKKAIIRLSCNLFSFNGPLTTGQMTLEQVLEFCSDLGFEAVDPTAYYFPGYPLVPGDDYIYHIKRKAFRLGLAISGTGVRNDFTQPEPERRKADVDLVKHWIDFAARFGAPVLRVFAGKGTPEGHTAEEVEGWVIAALRECTTAASKHGVILVLQNHADFIQAADQVIRVIRAVNSDWLALNLDIGSFRIGDPYSEIAKAAPYAATWQIKEKVFINGKETKTDLNKIIQIVRDSGYRGYLPLETLGEGDPRQKVSKFLSEIKTAISVVG